MTSSGTQTEGAAAPAATGPSDHPAARPRGWPSEHPAAVALVVLALAGWALIGQVNRWHIEAPAIALALGWVGLLLAGHFLWQAAQTAGREGDADQGFVGPSPREELEQEKRALLKAIKEVEFDVQLGKMSQADADDIVPVYRRRAIEILKELEGEDGRILAPRERVERELKARLALAGRAKKAPEPGTETGSGSEPAEAKS